MIRYLLLVTILFSLSSCLKDKYDLQNLDSSGYHPGVAAPLINTNLVLGELIKKVDTTYISADNNNLLRLTYASNLFSYNVADLISIPTQNISQSFSLNNFSIPNVNTSTSVTLGSVVANMNNPEKTTIQSANGNTAPFPSVPAQSGGSFNVPALSGFSSATFYQGTLTMAIKNNWPVQITNLQIEIRNQGNNSLIGTFNYPSIPASSTVSKNINLAGITMSSSIKMVIASFSSPGTFPAAVPIDLNDDLAFTISTSNIGLLSASAVFPSQQVLNQTIENSITMSNGEQLNTIVLKQGNISYDIDYGIRENAQVVLTLPYLTKNGSPFSQVINLTSNHVSATNVTGSFDLSGYTFDLTGGGGHTNYIAATISADVVSSGNPVPIDTADAVSADISIDNLAFSYVDGYLGNQPITVPTDSLDFSLFNKNLGMSVSLADPQITLKLKNSVGIPINGDLSALSVIGENGNTVTFTGISNPLVINSPSTVGQTANTNIVINKNTSNITTVLTSNPKTIIYGLSAATNPNGFGLNFITDSSAIDVSMEMDVPLYGSMSGFMIKDTLAFPAEAFKNVYTATLRSIITSEFPVEANVQMYFLDGSYAMVDSLFPSGYEQVVPSSIIDGNGELVAASAPKTTDMTVSVAMAEKLKAAKYIVVATKLATANNGTQAAKFYSTYKMNVKLGILAKVNINIKEN
ncbi:MAG: hypothetical protein ACO3EE_07480 [Flavobacteriales bacterium]